LKTVSKGYASFDHTKPVCILNLLARCVILHDNALIKKMCEKLKELIPRQQFDIPIQAAMGESNFA
jgi:GTP-binding protein LepA